MRHLTLSFAFVCLVATTASAQQVFHYWNFNNPSTSPTWPQPVEATSGSGEITYTFVESNVVSFAGTTINAQSGDPSGGSFVVQNGSGGVNNGRHFDLALPTTGFHDIVLAYATQRTSTGFSSQAFSYSLDGIEFTPFTTVTSIPSSFGLRTVDFSGVAGAANNPEFTVRVTLDGGDAGSTSGNNRFDNMRGVPLRIVQAILGHSNITITERYAHLAPDAMQAYMDRAFGNAS